ncbi:uncharacterized protein M2140_001622 [Clostridiales Family XIII bacterium PM5-7]
MEGKTKVQKMAVSELLKKMIDFYEGNLHDINHFIKVWTYAKTIGELEELDCETQYILEASAIIHDIACPLCREKYGNTNGKHQEEESQPLVEKFLQDCELTAEQTARIVYLVCHHHTYIKVDGLDHQILLEADYLVNADEAKYSSENMLNAEKHIFKTASGKALLNSIYGI